MNATDNPTTTIDDAHAVHAAGATITLMTQHNGNDYTRYVLADLPDEPLNAREAREVAAALLEAADQIDGRESSILSTKR